MRENRQATTKKDLTIQVTLELTMKDKESKG